MYDIVTGGLYVYYFHNYEEVFVFNLYDELARGENYYRIPDYVRQTKARYPIGGESVNPSSVTFLWNGNAEHYDLYYSTDPNFGDAKPVKMSTSVFPARSSMKLSALGFGALMIGMVFGRRKRILLMLGGVLMTITFASCKVDIVESPFAPSSVEHRLTVENLQPNAKYYWKVISVESTGICSQSSVQTFITRGLKSTS